MVRLTVRVMLLERQKLCVFKKAEKFWPLIFFQEYIYISQFLWSCQAHLSPSSFIISTCI